MWKRTTDGFRIAEEDLKIRGPGDFIGTRQSGLPDFRVQDALGDLTLLKKAREEAFGFLERDPELSSFIQALFCWQFLLHPSFPIDKMPVDIKACRAGCARYKEEFGLPERTGNKRSYKSGRPAPHGFPRGFSHRHPVFLMLGL
jgi:hypothetical protein